MAIKKTKELTDGTSGEYWVAEVKNNMQTKKTEIRMLLYKDQATRDAGKLYMHKESVPSIDGVYLSGEEVYTAIKASRMSEDIEGEEAVEQNWFADAEDILD
jgi:hypothetical protein